MSSYSKKMEKYERVVKIIIVGDAGAGKSALLHTFCTKKFDGHNKLSTIGIDFKIGFENIDGANIKFQFWDTGGQERFRNICKSYYRGAHGIMLVFDLTDFSSLQRVHEWIRSIDNVIGDKNYKLLLVGNKCEDTRNIYITDNDIQKVVTQFNIEYMQVSAKTTFNVDKSFKILTRDALLVAEANDAGEKIETIKLSNANNRERAAQSQSKCCE